MSKSQEPLEATPVEAHDDLVIHRDHWYGHPSRLSDQLFAGCRILRDVLRREVDTARRKKLFRRVT
jgi:hypothetical protein